MSRNSGKQTFGIKLSKNHQEIAISEVTSETDFVANTDLFKEFAKSVMSSLEDNKRTLTENCFNILKASSKLFESSFTLNDAAKHVISKTGENCTIRKATYLKCADNQLIGAYLHNSSFEDHCSSGAYCIINVDKNMKDIEKDKIEELVKLANTLCMQIVAMNPKFISEESIPVDILCQEKEIIREKVINNEANKKKPQEAIEKIISSGINKYIEETCLLKQDYVIINPEDSQPSQKVEKYIQSVSKKLGLVISIERFELIRPDI